jgi:hypothetical protein
MGVIGFELYDNDVAGDVQAAFTNMIQNGLSCSKATENMMEEFAEQIQDEDDGPIIWVALADTQWEMKKIRVITCLNWA